jgi:hypothetical protein
MTGSSGDSPFFSSKTAGFRGDCGFFAGDAATLAGDCFLGDYFCAGAF